MKKLLSICFLSILLGLLSFSAQAQNCGFLIKNLQPDTIPTQLGIAEGVAQMSPDGLLPLDHTLGSGVFINPADPFDYYGNANVGRTELYELFLCNTCNLDPKTKVSLDWILQRWNDATGEWETVNGNLSDYVDFDIYTLYSEINDTTGVCNRITWLGGRVPNGFGWCEPQVAPDMFHGITCNTPTNYPGALPVGQGTPYSVMNQLGELIPAMGMTPIYTEALDYFYYDFFSQTRTLLQLKWKQAGNYRLIMNLRNRVGGTAWTNLNWNDNETTDFIGGHQSCCDTIIASDTLTYPVFGKVKHAVCDDNIWEYGRPTFVFNEPDVNGVYPNRNFDTLVVFGEIIGSGEECSVFHTDSIHYVEFFVRHTPVMQIANDTLCKCASFTEDDLFDLATQDVSSPDHPVITIEWATINPFTHDTTWSTNVPSISSLNIPGINYFTVRQINTYDDTLDCVSEPVTFSVLFKEMTPPEINVPELTDFCLEALEGATLTLSAEVDEECANTVKWYTAFLPNRSMQFNWLKAGTLPLENYFSSYLDPATYIGSNELTINLADYMPSTNKDTVLYFFAVSYQDTTCPSPMFTYITVNLHQTPVLQKSQIKEVYCVSDEVVMAATVITTETEQPYTFNWTGITAINVDVTHVETDGKTVVEIAGTPKQSQGRMPVNVSKSKNYSQQIFTSEEVPAGTITKMAFNWANAMSKKTSNVEIYLGTTDKSAFTSKTDFVTSNLQLVYAGGLNATTTGWKELTFTAPYNYNGAENLVLVVKDNSNKSEDSKYFVCTQTADNKAMIIATDGNLPADPTTYTGTVNIYKYRSDVKFTVTPAVYANAQTVYNQLNPENECGHPYSTSVYVVDGNGCVSEPVQFDYTGNDTLAPTVTPAARVTRVEGCAVTADNWVLFENLAAFAQAGIVVKDDAVELNDNCGLPYVTFTHADTHLAGPCEDTIIRVYTFTDKCGKTATFNDTIISRDTQKPYFRDPETNQSPYIRMLPERGMNCTYNAPEKPAFVHAILGVVGDNCTEMDSLWLMDHATFYWEHSELFNDVLAPGTLDIFGPQVGNQLTVNVVIEDACGNADTALVLYFNRPDSLEILPPSITVDPANICLGESATLTFDPSKVDYDGDDFDVATPLTYAWSNLEHLVDVSDATDPEITVTPSIGDTTYHFQVTVTDAYGCTATSEYAPLYVKDNPHVKIIKDVRNGATEPYCPNYGDLTIVAVDAATETKIPNLIYTWSGESVNVNASIEDTSFIVIVPDYCDWHYTAYVHVQDSIYGCVGDASITVWAADTAGPEYTGDVINDTVDIQPQCKMYVPDFIHYLNNANIIDNCYSFSEFYETFRQDPPAGTEMTEDTPVTIYVTTPCQEAEYPIVNKFFARVPDNHLKVTAAVAPTHACEPADFTFTATPIDGAAPITYSWTKANSTWTGNGQVVVVNDEMVANGAISSVYTYTVEAVDALNCHATASVNDTVYMTVLDIDTATYPNTNCLAPWNGQLVVFHAPIGTHYVLTNDGFYMERVSEVPGWDTQVMENTLIFDFLPAGDYLLTVTTSHQCVSTFDIHIPGIYAPVEFNNEVTPHNPTYCTNDNGYITINVEAGYTYEVYAPNGTLVASPYTGLTVGTYKIVKTSIATRCADSIFVNINESSTTMTFPASASPNTLCGDEEFNGKVTFNGANNAGWTYVVTDEAGTQIYEGGPTQLTTLAEGHYTVYGTHTQTGCVHQKTVEVENGRNNPVFTVTTTPNNYCENEDGLVNGKISYSPASSYTYTVTNTDNNVVVTNLNALAAGHYNVYAINAEHCWKDTNVTILNERYYPTYQATSQENTSCNPELLAYNGSITIAVSANVTGMPITNATTAFNSKIKPFYVNLVNVENEVDLNTQFNGTPATFTGLNSGIYNFTITSQFLCEVEGEIEVEQHKMPDLLMHATPNTMCEPTFEKPGNGTIVMDSATTEFGHVYYRDPIFDYSFYFASTTPAEGFESVDGYYPGTQLQVNYWVPISYTMYYLADSLYYVMVYDRLTGCDVADTITVPKGLDNMVAEAQSTPNKNCKAPYDGTVTATATAYKLNTTNYNLDAVLAFRLVGEDVNFATEYQLGTINAGTLNSTFTTTFTGLPDGTYTLYVQDTTTKCVYPFEGAVTVDKTPSDIMITPTISPNHACEIEGETTTPWDGALTAVASSAMFTNAQWVYKFYSVDSLGVVWHKEADATYGTTNSWSSLETGAYTVFAMDNVSGCAQDSVFAIPTENICAPTVTFTATNRNSNPEEFHFCLNTPDAGLCAHATTESSECPATEYDYKWHVNCHDQNYTGECITIPTDEVHCCTYTVTVTSLATGCKTVVPVSICIDPIHTINYLVNDEPFLDVPRTVYNCVNKEVKIGIEQNSWVNAWWTNDHVEGCRECTPGVFDFVVPANSTEVGHMYSYCVNTIDENGCEAQGVINLISLPVPVTTVYDTACSCIPITKHAQPYSADGVVPGQGQVIDPDLQPWTPVPVFRVCYNMFTAQDAPYEYTVTEEGYINFEYADTIFNGAVNGCDSITIHKVTLIGDPTITGTVDYNFCNTQTVADAISGLTIGHAIDTIITINGVEVELTDALEFSNCEMVEMIVTAISGSFLEDGDEQSCSVSYPFNFIVNAAPKFTDEEIDVEEAYCANGQPVDIPTPMPEFNCNYCVMSVEYGDIMIDGDDHCDLHLYVMETNHTVFADLGVVTPGADFVWTPRLAYDGKLLALVAHNPCGYDTIYAVLDIDSTTITINPVELCEGEALDLDKILKKHYDQVTAYVKYVVETNMVPETRTVTYVPSENFSATENLYNSATPNYYDINEDLKFTATLEGGTNGPVYNNGYIRLYRSTNPTHNGNKLIITASDDDADLTFTGITINASSNNAPTGITLNDNNLTKSGNVYTATDLNTDHLTIQNNTTATGGSGNLFITSMTINYTVTVESVTYDEQAYVVGTPMTMAEDGAGLYIEVNGEVCDPIITNTTTITVNPKPALDLGNLPLDVCYDDAVDALDDAIVNVEDADAQGWLVPTGTTTTLWTEGFESGVIPTSWTTVTDAEGDGWFVTNAYSHSGSNSSISASYESQLYGGAVHTQDWLITPAINAQIGTTLSYYHKNYSTSYPDSYDVYVLEAPQADYYAAPILTHITPSTMWTENAIDLTSYAGKTVYVAFYHHDYNKWRLYFDDFTLTQTGYTSYATTAALVEAIKDNANTDVYYYVQNDCGTDLQNVGTVRILDKLTLSVNEPQAICPNAVFNAVLSQLTYTKGLGNYLESETELYYTTEIDGTTYTLGQYSPFPYGFTDGSVVTVHLTTVDGVVNCGDAEADVVVHFLTNGPVPPTFKPACDGAPLSAFVDQAPQWNGTVTLADEYWEVNDKFNGTFTTHRVDENYVFTYANDPWVRYVWVTDCGETFYSHGAGEMDFFKNLVINRAPEITQLVNQFTLCEGASIAESDLHLSVTYHGNEDKYDTVYTMNNATPEFPLTFNTAGTYTLNVKIDDGGEACGIAEQNVTIYVNPIPEPHAKGDTIVCLDGTANFNVVNPSSTSTYTWYYGENVIGTGTQISVMFGEVTGQPNQATMTTYATTLTVDKQELYEFKVVELASGCPSTTMVNESADPFSENVITVKVTNLPQFVFYDKDGNKTHHINAADGNAFTTYYWEVDKKCPNSDILVWVDFTIYYQGEENSSFRLIPNDSIGEFIQTQKIAAVTGGMVQYWTHSDSIHWTSGDQTKEWNKVFRYNATIPSTNSANVASTNHFPNASMFTGNNNVYTDVYLYFLDEIDTVKKQFAPFLQGGEYKVVYRLNATSNFNDFMTPYYNHEYNTPYHIGGQNPFAPGSTQTLLAIDSIYITVENPYVPSNTPGDELVTNPDLAPSLALDETVAPDMEVWPNPAPAVETTLKARVHNMSGNAIVTLTNLTGKVVYSGDTYIDNDNYYFEFNVTGLSVGSYIMTVRTDADIVTKKVVIARLAR